MIRRNMDTPEARAFWEHVDATAREVESWPLWKRRACLWVLYGYPPECDKPCVYDGLLTCSGVIDG